MQPGRPRLSVVLPVYRVQQYLPQCLDSVLAAPAGDLEVIAVDDASPDGCGQILDERAAADPRLQVIHLPVNGGPGNARNLGLDRATGDYLWFIDGDDLVTDGAVEAIIGRLTAQQPDVLLIDYEHLYPAGQTRPSPGGELLAAAPPATFRLTEQPAMVDLAMPAWSRVFRRAFLAELGVRYAPGIHEDVLVSVVTMLAASRIAVLDRVCYRYRSRRGSFMASTSSGNLAIFDAYQQVFEYMAKREADPAAEVTPALRKALFERAIWHYSTVLQTGGLGIGPVGRSGLVPRRERHRFFARMHADFARYAPPGYQRPDGPRGAKFRLVERNAYWCYELLEPLNKVRVALHRRIFG
jgi:CDP-glycerol glycerophosphotransferase